jgi:predicted O-linked N-acetylglucosamine transferase (SPINDLY family)
MKPDRNAHCPCGSGKKYKKCCGASSPAAKKTASKEDPFQQALSAYQRGDFGAAEMACDVVLRDFPDHPDAVHLCGVVAYRVGKSERACTLLGRAVQCAPNNSHVWSNLSLAQCETGDFLAAEASALRALSLNDRLPDAHNNLGVVQRNRGDITGALGAFRRAAEIDPSNPTFLTNLAGVLQVQDELDEAERLHHRALVIEPSFVPAMTGIATVYVARKRWAEAQLWLERAIAAGANDVVMWNNWGLTLHKLKDPKGAVEAYRRALSLNPNQAGTYYNLGMAFEDLGKTRGAYMAYAQAVELGYTTDDVFVSFFHAAGQLGELDNIYAHAVRLRHDTKASVRVLLGVVGVLGQACDFNGRREVLTHLLAAAQRAELNEDTLESLLMLTTYENSIPEDRVIELHRQWGSQVEVRTENRRFHHDKASFTNQRLRIGYFSPDFRHHSVGHFIRHVLAHHDRSKFEIYCYSLASYEDDVTAIIARQVDHFVRVSNLDEFEIAARIYKDRIQLLIDLAGHSASNRLAVLAYRPAPVQLTWIGYLHTTGLKDVDYRVTDLFADDPRVLSGTEERLILPESFLCFGEFPDCPIEPQPAMARNGFVTFASFNNLTKITDDVVRVWARILQATRGSRMRIMATGAGAHVVRRNLDANFVQYGVDPARLQLVGALPRLEYLRAHNEVDIILDAWPFNGGTVTAGALWMGVSVITLVGSVHRQRVSYSMLKNIGMEETIAWSENDYVHAAVSLAQDPAKLAAFRQTIAAGTRRSTLCDAPRFTRQLEEALRRAWDEHYARNVPSGVAEH